MQRQEWMGFSNRQILACNEAVLRARTRDHDRGHEFQRAERFKEIDGTPDVRFEGFLRADQRNSWIALSGKMENSLWCKFRNELRETRAVPHITVFESSVRPRILGLPVINPEH